MRNKVVPILYTWDVDPVSKLEYSIRSLDSSITPETHYCNSLERSLDFCKDLEIKSTFFFTARPTLNNADIVKEIQGEGHTIGCHGLTHSSSEEFDKLSLKNQYVRIKEATNILHEVTGVQVRHFRSPRVKISRSTLHVLQKLGYYTDSSVCSQRADLFSSNLFNLDWIKAPRNIYYPSHKNPFTSGNMSVLEIPISALLLPFISGSLSIFGIGFMKFLFQILYRESIKTGKPIVFLNHPIEFLSKKKGIR